MARLITFEGIEGCGKTTQIKLAGKYLEQLRIPFIITAEPGGTHLGRKIREILLNKSPYETVDTIYSETEVLLFCAARAQHVREVIIPALNERKWVLCDRFSDATIAYQGFGRGLDIDFIGELNEFSSVSLKPALTILFDLPVEVGLKRALDRISRIKDNAGKLSEDRFEHEDLAFHRRIRDGYLHLAKQEPERFRVVDASKEVEAVHREVCLHLDALISGKSYEQNSEA